MSKPWVRLYRGALNNPKIGRLGFEATGMWAICLMLSDDEGVLPDDRGIAWASRYPVDGVTELMGRLLRNGLVTRYGNGYRLHDWDQHQRSSDYDASGAERQRRWRERQKAQKSASDDRNALRNALHNGTVTLPDTDTDTDNPTLTSFVLAPIDGLERSKARVPKRGTALAGDFVMPLEWIEDGLRARERQGKCRIDLGPEAERFVNHFVANGKAMKDWRRTWLNWATSPFVDQLKGKSNGTRLGNTIRDIAREIGDAEARADGGGDLSADGEGGDDLG